MSALVVFDLDGTLIDSRRDLAESTNEVLETYGARPLPLERVVAMVGDGAKKLVERALEAAGADPGEPDALERFRVIYDRRLLGHTRPYDGVVDAVRRVAARAELAVLTNKPERPARRLLEAFDMAEAFRWIIGGDSGFPRKPDPAALRHLVAESGAAPSAALFVGDSMVNLETARRAGVRVVFASYGFGRERGDLVLRGDELIAHAPADVATLVEEALE